MNAVKGRCVGPRDDFELLRARHDQHAHSLLSYVIGLTNGDRARARDVVQETLLRAWRNAAVRHQTGGWRRRLVQAALQTLSIEHRQVLFECYYRDASVAEAAETLGVSPDTVKSRSHYALHALRQAVDGMS
jgi:RNA polymerase sigma-70 factor, ECF subfamily